MRKRSLVSVVDEESLRAFITGHSDKSLGTHLVALATIMTNNPQGQ